MHAKKSARLAALLLCIALCLCACSSDSASAPENTSVVLPEPPRMQHDQILGSHTSEAEQEVTLYFASENNLSFNSATRSIPAGQDESLIANTLDALFSDDAPGASAEVGLIGYDEGCGIVNVNLSLEAGVNRSDQDYLLLCASIANSLLSLDGVEAVNILTGNRSDPLCGLPLGVFVQPQENIAAVYAQIHSESERFPSLTRSTITRNVMLYFPSTDGSCLLPEVRELSFETDDYASAVISALAEGPLMRSCSFSAVPGSMDLLVSAPELAVSDTGERIIELNFASMLTDYLAFAGVQPWQFYGSLALSLCGFVPETDALRISIDGFPVTECEMSGQRLVFENGLMRRSDFTPIAGSSAQIYFANASDMLTRVEMPMSQSAALSAYDLLCTMIGADIAHHADIRSVFPEGITAQDILGVRVEDGTAIVNLSGRFYSRCQGISERQERLLVYAMVNTLAELEQVGAVSFLVEGNQIDSLAQNIYLKTSLLPDSGLVQGAA